MVMSTFTYESFGDLPGCVGSDPKTFKKCVIELHSNEEEWYKVRDEGIEYILDTHSREKTMDVFAQAIEENYREQEVGHHKLLDGKIEHDEAAIELLNKQLARQDVKH